MNMKMRLVKFFIFYFIERECMHELKKKLILFLKFFCLFCFGFFYFIVIFMHENIFKNARNF